MGRRLSFLAILAICVTGTFSIPQEPDPINIPEYPEDLPIPCEWKEWGECSGTCGEGIQTRDFYPSVNGGNDCTGSSSQKCNNTTPCPIDCKWGQWGICSTTCGNGISKKVIEQQAQHGGKQCDFFQVTKKCNLKPCPIDCKWGQWGPCSTTCGQGNQNRVIEQQAQHGGRKCQGQAIEECNLKPCPYDCVWGQWGTCSETCGSGIQRRAVRLEARNGGETCMGEKIRDCNQIPCPIDCKWSQWGICSSNCGDGEQERTFEIEAQHDGQECQGEAKRNCNEGPCDRTISLTELMHYELCKDWQSYTGYNIPNPENCKTYFQCQANGAFRGGYEAILRYCGAQTGFDPSLGNCNFLGSLPRCVRDYQPKYVDHGSSCVLELYSEQVLRGKTRSFRSSSWVFSGDAVRSVKNSGGCCWDVYSSSRKFKFFTAIKPGYTNLEINGSFYLKKRKCEPGEF